jgi:hypothetical protein
MLLMGTLFGLFPFLLKLYADRPKRIDLPLLDFAPPPSTFRLGVDTLQKQR